MKPIVVDNIFSEQELYFLYKQVISSPVWSITGASYKPNYPSKNIFLGAPHFVVKGDDENISNYPMYLYGQSIVYRIAKILKNKKIGMGTNLERMWFNITYSDSSSHHLHQDDDRSNTQSILLFLTPVWNANWAGSFYIAGEQFKFKPGNAIVFDSRDYHMGESPTDDTFNWHRLTCNIKVK